MSRVLELERLLTEAREEADTLRDEIDAREEDFDREKDELEDKIRQEYSEKVKFIPYWLPESILKTQQNSSWCFKYLSTHALTYVYLPHYLAFTPFLMHVYHNLGRHTRDVDSKSQTAARRARGDLRSKNRSTRVGAAPRKV